MRIWWLCLSLAMLAGLPARAAEPEAAYAAYDRLLAEYGQTGADGVTRFDYASWRSDEDDFAMLQDVVAMFEQQAPSTMTRNEAFAFWVNLYNADTLLLILEEYPVDSIRNIKSGLVSIGPWGRERVSVEGETLSLGDIEHEILRKAWDEPRVHYAVNCASIGCPNLKLTAWRAGTLDADLTAAAIGYINDPRGVSFDDRGRMSVSRIFKWFRKDFGKSNAEVIDHILIYAEEDLAASIRAAGKISGHAYDWGLNKIDLGATQ